MIRRCKLFITSLLILFILLFAQSDRALAAGTGENSTLVPSFTVNKDRVVANSVFKASFDSLNTLYDRVVAVYRMPSGKVAEFECELDEDSNHYLLSTTPKEIGEWKLESLLLTTGGKTETVSGSDFSGDFIVGSSLSELYGTEAPSLLIGYGFEDGAVISAGKLNYLLKELKVIEKSGEYTDFTITLSGDQGREVFDVENDGITFESSQPLKTFPDGNYTITISKDAEVLETAGFRVGKDEDNGIFHLSSVNSSASLSNVNYVQRLWGKSRYDTAVNISESTFPSATGVVLVNPVDFPDSLAAVGFANAINAPILYSYTDELHPSTVAEMNRLKAENVYLVGGPLKLSGSLKLELERKGYHVERISGTSRFGTAIDLASCLSRIKASRTAILVVANNYPDALSAGPYAAMMAHPILYTYKDSLETGTKRYISKNIDDIIIVGGEGVVSDKVAKELRAMKKSVTRVSGNNRFETSVNFAKKYFGTTGNLVLASGRNYPDALAGGVLAAQNSCPIILTEPESFPKAVTNYLSGAGFEKAFLLGGEKALSDSVFTSLKGMMKSSAKPETTPEPKPEPAPQPAPESSEPKPEPEEQPLVRHIQPRKFTPDDPIRIMLDPGHGYGYNKGVVNGYFEGDMTIKLAFYLKAELERYGFVVGITRTEYGKHKSPAAVLEREKAYRNGSPINNQIYSLASRGAMAKDYDLLLSLHSNAGADVRGSEIFDSVVSPCKELSDRLVQTISNAFGHRNRKTKYKAQDDGRDWYGVLRGSKATHSMLIEHGFHSNYQDCTLLYKDDFLKTLAKLEAEVLADFYGAK